MEMLSETSCSEWLGERLIPEDPCHQQECPTPFYDQAWLPAEPLRKAWVIRSLFGTCVPYGSALLQFTDWDSTPDETAVLHSIRKLYGDDRPLIESPGHLFTPEEHDLIVGMFTLGMLYGYSAYVHFDHHATVFGWEGEAVDFFSPDESRLGEAQRVFTEHGLARSPADA